MAALPKQYKACVYDEPGKVSTKVVDLDMPEPGSGEVLINLYARCLCLIQSSHHPTDNAIQAPTPASATPISAS